MKQVPLSAGKVVGNVNKWEDVPGVLPVNESGADTIEKMALMMNLEMPVQPKTGASKEEIESYNHNIKIYRQSLEECMCR